MRSLAILTVCAAMGLTSCAGRLAAKPGVGVGVEHRPDGGRLGVDFGEVSVGGEAIEPLTGNCPGGVCAVPGAPSRLPTLTVETKVPAAVMWGGGLFALAFLGGLAYVVTRKAK